MLTIFDKVFIFLLVSVCLFKAEIFPFSNYQMYSKTFLPGEAYEYYELRAVTHDGAETDFNNKKYGLFHSKQPLVESLIRHRHEKENYSFFLKGVYEFKNIRDDFKEIRLYKVYMNWSAYKAAALLNHGRPSEMKKAAFIKDELIAKYPNDG